jgi:hypothetical protein
MNMPKVLSERIQDFARPISRGDWRTCNQKIANPFTRHCLRCFANEYHDAKLKDYLDAKLKDYLDANRFGHLDRFIEENKDRYIFYMKRYEALHGHSWFKLLML